MINNDMSPKTDRYTSSKILTRVDVGLGLIWMDAFILSLDISRLYIFFIDSTREREGIIFQLLIIKSKSMNLLGGTRTHF